MWSIPRLSRRYTQYYFCVAVLPTAIRSFSTTGNTAVLVRQRSSTAAAARPSPSLARFFMTTSSSSNSDSSSPVGNSMAPSMSGNIETTLDPCVVLMKEMIGKYSSQWEDKAGIYSLAQGVVYWRPPSSCREALLDAVASSDENELHLYGPDEGLPELRETLLEKVSKENGLDNHDLMVTVGANQAYMNCVMTLLSSSKHDKAIVFRPYYFNHVMALQMTISDENIVVGPVSDSGLPDLDWLETTLKNDTSIQMVTLTNPGNPTGVSLDRTNVAKIVNLCRAHGCWLVLDATYEYFTVDDTFDGCFREPHCIHIFSLSKAYALAGYRCGYVAVSKEAKSVFANMVKVQDTVPIAPSRISQVAALGALQAGREWVAKQVRTLDTGRRAILSALSPLSDVMGGTGAMYIMGKLPSHACDDQAVAEQLVADFGVAVIPGSYCGFPGWIRVCYANLPPDDCTVAAQRLEQGMRHIVAREGT